MAREFGPKSYKPENVTFTASGHVLNNESGMPWGGVKRQAQKNILLEASNNPSTVEELAFALGISVPYMEEEVKILTRGTLLKKVGDKYVTNISILSAEVQKEIFDMQLSYVSERAELLNKIADDCLPKIRSLGCVRNGKITDDELKWWVVCSLSHICEMSAADFRTPVRENGERWGFVGYEEAELPGKGCFISNINNGDWKRVVLRHFIVHSKRIAADIEEPYQKADAAILFADIVKNDRKISDLNDAEKKLWKQIDGVYAHSDENGSVIPDILIFEGGGYAFDAPSVACDIYSAHPDSKSLAEIDEKVHRETVEILKKVSSPVLSEQLSFVASMAARVGALSVDEIIEKGRLLLPEDPGHFKATIDLWIA